MTARRLLNILALVSLLATATAVAWWRYGHEAPPRILLQISLAGFIGALLMGLIGEETRPRIMLRFLAALASLAAVIAFVADYSQFGFNFSSASDHLGRWAPSVLAALRSGLTRMLGELGWQLVSTVLAVPSFILFGIVAVVCGVASRPRERLSIFVN